MQAKSEAIYNARLNNLRCSKCLLIQIAGLFSLLFLLLANPVLAGTPSIHEGLAHRLTIAAHESLIRYGHCLDSDDCTRKQLVYWALTEKSVELSLYNVDDLRVVSSIAAYTLKEFDLSGQAVFLSVQVHREKREDVSSVVGFRKTKPYCVLMLRGVK